MNKRKSPVPEAAGIPSIEQIKNSDERMLNAYAVSIRQLLIETVTHTGGHLASNLGVVELTLALHYVFDSPRDKIIWDVGHQSYVHKIITGRADRFSTLRQKGGISGFPLPEESEHDVFGAGHASTSISAALGFARARDLLGGDNSVVAVIGDGAMGGGLAFEAINDAGRSGTQMTVILNDNGMSISRNVGAMARSLAKMRTSPRYKSFKKGLKTFLTKTIGIKLTEKVERAKNRIKYMLLPVRMFEDLGFLYIGPIDGHDIGQLISALETAKRQERPVLLHIVTQKGRGSKAAEESPENYHGLSPEANGVYSYISMSASEVFGKKLLSLAESDGRITAITAAMRGGVGMSKFAVRYPDRFFDVGIAEQHALTMSAGMAAAGLRPVCAIYSTFLQRGYDQLLHDIALQKLPVIVAVDRAGLTGEDGRTHQGIYDISYLRHLPGFTVLSPSTNKEIELCMDYAMTLDAPCAIRYPRGSLGEGAWDMPFDKGLWTKAYDPASPDGYIIAVGRMVDTALKAAARLHGCGINIGVVNARSIKPLDTDMLSKLQGRLFTLEDNVREGGFGSAVAETGAAVDIIAIECGIVDHMSVEEQLVLAGLDDISVYKRIKNAFGTGEDSDAVQA